MFFACVCVCSDSDALMLILPVVKCSLHVFVSAVDSDALMLILPVICRQVQSSTYKLDTTSIQSSALTDVDNMLKVSCLLCPV